MSAYVINTLCVTGWEIQMPHPLVPGGHERSVKNVELSCLVILTWKSELIKITNCETV